MTKPEDAVGITEYYRSGPDDNANRREPDTSFPFGFNVIGADQ